MATRLSVLTHLGKYEVPDPPRWRTRRPEDDLLFTLDYQRCAHLRRPAGAAYLDVSQPVMAAQEPLTALVRRREERSRRGWPRSTWRTRRRLLRRTTPANFASTAANMSCPRSTHSRRHVIDPSTEQSATAVLDKISGAVLIGARQRQARAQLLAGVVEQLLVESKRARDTEAAAMNMQLVTWRDGRAANEAFVAGTGDALTDLAPAVGSGGS